jgi:hypothetical protein
MTRGSGRHSKKRQIFTSKAAFKVKGGSADQASSKGQVTLGPPGGGGLRETEIASNRRSVSARSARKVCSKSINKVRSFSKWASSPLPALHLLLVEPELRRAQPLMCLLNSLGSVTTRVTTPSQATALLRWPPRPALAHLAEMYHAYRREAEGKDIDQK